MGRAAKLYAAASEQGNVKAIVALGLCYKAGAGVAADEQKALQLFEAAAQKGNHRGMYHLGSHLLHVDGDTEKGTAWLQAAADKGNRDALDAINRLADPASAHKQGMRRSRKSATPPAASADEEREGGRSGGMHSDDKDSFADLSSTSNLLGQARLAPESGATSVSEDESASSFDAQPDKRFSCPGLDTSSGLSPSQFDVPGRQSMAPQPAGAKEKKRAAKEQMPSSLGHDNVELPNAYSQSPAAKVRCGISSFFKRK
jgi:TPR repeat protein